MHRILSIRYIIPIIALILAACVKPYVPDTDKYEQLLVIDGLLVDTENVAEATVAYTFDDYGRTEYVSGANVYIEDGDGNTYTLDYVETDNKSVYRYTGEEQIGKVGSVYKLIIEFDGKTYESTNIEMQPVADIENISYGQITEVNGDGLQLFISTNGTDAQSKYYNWVLDETWEFKTQIYAPKYQDKQVCWFNRINDDLILGTTETFSGNSFLKHRLHFIPKEDQRLRIRYSLLLKQMSIDNNTYKYLDHIKNISKNTGSLFDPIPSSMKGNISCTDESVPVIGNFQVSACKTKRIFIDNNDLPDGLLIGGGSMQCSQYSVQMGQTLTMDSLIASGFSILDTMTWELNTFVRFIQNPVCVDCTANGDPNTPPDWWITADDE